MAKLLIIFITFCVALLHVAIALECYSCDAELCLEVQERWYKTTCIGILDREPVCLKFSFRDQYGRDLSRRRCGSVPETGDLYCEDIHRTTNAECLGCNTDLCNSASSINMSFTAFVGIALGVLNHKLISI